MKTHNYEGQKEQREYIWTGAQKAEELGHHAGACQWKTTLGGRALSLLGPFSKVLPPQPSTNGIRTIKKKVIGK